MASEQPRLSDQFKSEIQSPHVLNHVETKEKQVLPTTQDVKQEKQHLEFKEGIEKFNHEQLSHVDTNEKHILPTSEEIAKEKVPQLAADFDREKLSHVEPVIKHSVEVIEQ